MEFKASEWQSDSRFFLPVHIYRLLLPMSADDDVFKLPDILARWPWKSAINKHYEKCDIESMAWSESFHAFSPKAQKIFNLCKPNLLSSRAYPNASNGCACYFHISSANLTHLPT